MPPPSGKSADLHGFFSGYAAAFNRSLGDSVDVEGIRAFFSDEFIAAGPAGVKTGRNDETFAKALEKGYAFYRQIGTRRIAVLGLVESPIDETHRMVRVFYRAGYQRKDGNAVGIDFDVHYLMDLTDTEPKIFGFIAGDEMAAFRQAGLID